MIGKHLVQIRPARPEDAESIARVQVDTWRTAYRGIVPDEFLRRLSYEISTRGWRKRLQGGDAETFLFVAEEETAGIVGFVSGGPLREAIEGRPDYRGEVYAIYVRDEYQRQGIGSRLLMRAFRRLAEQGMGAVVVWVLAENINVRFYEALGGTPIARRMVTIGGADLAEIAYAWRQDAFGF